MLGGLSFGASCIGAPDALRASGWLVVGWLVESDGDRYRGRQGGMSV